MGRRWGKTFLSSAVAASVANYGGRAAWIAPTYKNSRPMWRMCEQIAAQSKAITAEKAERILTFPSGGSLSIYSADNPDAIRGEAFHLVIVDEAARVSPEAWQDAIEPTLADYDGRAFLISTPKGRNWFFEEWTKANADSSGWSKAWTAPSSANPNPNIRAAFERARERVLPRTFKQEWLAEFVDDGAFFTNVLACATAAPQDAALEGHSYVIGVDWARASGGDYTVFVVMDATTKSMAHLVRYNGMAFDNQLVRLKALHERFNGASIIAETNAMGMPLIEQLQRADLPVMPFTTTAATKHEIISALALAFEQGAISILNDSVLTGELQAFEVKARAGLPSYSAPDGMHDDCVMALAFAWHGVAHSTLQLYV